MAGRKPHGLKPFENFDTAGIVNAVPLLPHLSCHNDARTNLRLPTHAQMRIGITT